MGTSAADLEEALSAVDDPILEEDIISLNLINDITVEDGTATVSLAFNTPYAPAEIEMGEEIRDIIIDEGLEPELSAEVSAEHGFDDEILPNIRNVIAVSSGKGGVGKTTVAANLAAGLEARGAYVGLLDADIHGPNVPRVLPVDEEPGVTPNEEELVPPDSDGVKIMSMGFLVRNQDDPAIMRGPMVNNVMTHFLRNVKWGYLDYLVVDLPPGTGDASLNLLQSLPITGTVIVTTPQQMSIDDAKKGLRLFEKHDTPVLGIVENMATFHCANCGDTHDPFGDKGAQAITDNYDVELAGSLPIHSDYGADGTSGPVVKDPDSDVQAVTEELVETIVDNIGAVNREIVSTDARQGGEEPIGGPMQP